MKALELVNRLTFVRSAGAGKWLARCPSHDDKSPSLSIQQLDDGRVLVHCHAGCGALDILSSVGLSWDSLFPDEGEYRTLGINAPRETIDSLIIEIAEHDRKLGKRMKAKDKERYRNALKRETKASDVIVEIAYESGVIK